MNAKVGLTLRLLCGLATPAAAIATPVVSNVHIHQPEGTRLVEIRYDLAGDPGRTYTVGIEFSADGGQTFSAVTGLTGAVGAGIAPGSGRQVQWDAREDWAAAYFPAVQARVTATETISTEGLVAYYPFNGNANDESGNGHHGSILGAVLVADRFGNKDSAYSFSGADMIVLPIDEPLNRNDFTVSIWANHNGDCSSTYCFPITKGWNGVWNYFAVYKNFVGIGDATTNIVTIPTLNVVENNKWYHYLVVRQSEEVRFYLNGVLQGAISSSVNISNSFNWVIGSQNGPVGAHFFTGLIDEVKIYSRALNEQELIYMFSGH